MDDLAADGLDSLLETRRGWPAPIGPLVTPELDLEPNGICSRFEFSGQPIGSSLRNAVLRSPRPKLAEAAEQIEPRGKARRRWLPALMAIPESKQFLERSRVRHRKVEPADHRLVGAIRALPALAGVTFGEVLVRIAFRLFVTQVLETLNALSGAMEVVDAACHVHHERTLGRDPRRIVSQGRGVPSGFEHAPQTLKDGFETLALPRAARSAEVARASRTSRTSIKFRDRNRQQRELRHAACLRLQRPATVPARGSAVRRRSRRVSSRPWSTPRAAARLGRIPRLRHS